MVEHVSIRQRSHIKSIFVSMLLHVWNLSNAKHLRITNCVDFESFLIVINLDVMSSFNVFSTLVSVFRYNVSLFFNFSFKKKVTWIMGRNIYVNKLLPIKPTKKVIISIPFFWIICGIQQVISFF